MIILGSASPRRREILGYFSLPFEVRSSSFDELSIPFQGNPYTYVEEIAKGKAAQLHSDDPNPIYLTADTTVCIDGEILNKPSSQEEAYRMLKKMNGKSHQVITGVCVQSPSRRFVGSESTQVEFNLLDENQMKAYTQDVDILDKTGAYAIQGVGGLLVKGIEGCFYNVMGLPLNTTAQLLEKVNIKLWDYLAPSS